MPDLLYHGLERKQPKRKKSKQFDHVCIQIGRE